MRGITSFKRIWAGLLAAERRKYGMRDGFCARRKLENHSLSVRP